MRNIHRNIFHLSEITLKIGLQKYNIFFIKQKDFKLNKLKIFYNVILPDKRRYIIIIELIIKVKITLTSHLFIDSFRSFLAL